VREKGRERGRERVRGREGERESQVGVAQRENFDPPELLWGGYD